MGTLIVYSSFLLFGIGALWIFRPPKFIKWANRKRGFLLFAIGAFLVLLATMWPMPLHQSANSQSIIDKYMPEYHAREYHSISLDSSPNRIFEAIHRFKFNDIRLIGTLMQLRNLPLKWLGADEAAALGKRTRAVREEPGFVEALTRYGPFILLEQADEQEIALGLIAPTFVNELQGAGAFADITTPAAFSTFSKPGYFNAVMNFSIQPQPNGLCMLATETRILVPDAVTRRQFAFYWQIVAPWSGLIRQEILKSIQRQTADIL